jgi:phage gpG-like protein
MRAEFKGDLKKLQRHQKKLQRFPTQALELVSLQLAEQAIELVRDGIASGKDPYGKPYEPLKIRKGQPLRRTGRMQMWFRKSHTARGFQIAPPVDYAKYHQRGTGIYGPSGKPIKPVRAKALKIPAPGGAMFRSSVKGTPRRAMVPYRGSLPASWKRSFQATANEALTQYFHR